MIDNENIVYLIRNQFPRKGYELKIEGYTFKVLILMAGQKEPLKGWVPYSLKFIFYEENKVMIDIANIPERVIKGIIKHIIDTSSLPIQIIKPLIPLIDSTMLRPNALHLDYLVFPGNSPRIQQLPNIPMVHFGTLFFHKIKRDVKD